MKPTAILLILAILPALSGAEKTATPAGDSVLKLDNFKVQGEAVCSYAIGLRVQVDRRLKKTSIVITEVVEGSDASRLGLQPGDEIVKIDGRAVETMDPAIEKHSALGRIFLNRRPGEPLDLEVVTVRKGDVTLHAQRDAGP